jgi:hypothetical protein
MVGWKEGMKELDAKEIAGLGFLGRFLLHRAQS